MTLDTSLPCKYPYRSLTSPRKKSSKRARSSFSVSVILPVYRVLRVKVRDTTNATKQQQAEANTSLLLLIDLIAAYAKTKARKVLGKKPIMVAENGRRNAKKFQRSQSQGT